MVVAVVSPDPVSAYRPHPGPPDVAGQSSASRLSTTASVVAALTLALAVVTLVVFLVQDHREPWAINDETLEVAVVGVVMAALAASATALGLFLRRRHGSGAFWSLVGLCVAAPLGAVLVLTWLPVAG